MSKIKKMLTVVAATVGLLFGTGIVAANASPADGSYAYCQIGTTQADWTGKDPSQCKSGYVLYKDWQVVLHIGPVAEGDGIWGAIRDGYDSAQRWCANNSLTCTVLTGIGVTIAAPLISGATS